MKKLLTILTATGLVATTGISVVACTNLAANTETPVKTSLGIDTPIPLSNWDKIKKNGAGKTLSLSVSEGLIFSNPDAEGITLDSSDSTKATLDIDKGTGTITVKANQIGEDLFLTIAKNAEVKVEETKIVIAVDKYSISNVVIADTAINYSLDNLKIIIQLAIDNVISGTVLGTDYTVNGDTNAVGSIEVVAMNDSNLITGSFVINIVENRHDVADINFNAINTGWTTISVSTPNRASDTLLATTIKQIIDNSIDPAGRTHVFETKDFIVSVEDKDGNSKISGKLAIGDVILITAVSTSAIIIGTTSLTVVGV